ncbi:MAG: hypothetical protein KDB86_09750 [Actinobacteria bacterium]|nr:hypothetical protein [Actinomycetota bacterium]
MAKSWWLTVFGILALLAAGCDADSTEIPDSEWLNKSVVSNADALLGILPPDVQGLLSGTHQPDASRVLVSCVSDELAMMLDAEELSALVSPAKERHDFSTTGKMALSLYPNLIREASKVCVGTLFAENSQRASTPARSHGAT